MERKKNPSAFLRNTYDILERPEFNSIIGWSNDGTGFIIHDLPKFEIEILPQYFKHKKFTSFVRQLNMYGFHKQRHNSCENYFQHESFRRGDNLSEIRRKPEKKKKGCEEDRKGSDEEEVKKSISLEMNQHQEIGEEHHSELSPNIISLCELVMRQNQFLRAMRPIICEKILKIKNQKKCYLIEENEDHVEREQPNHHYLESINELQELCMEMRENTTKVGELGSTHD